MEAEGHRWVMAARRAPTTDGFSYEREYVVYAEVDGQEADVASFSSLNQWEALEWIDEQCIRAMLNELVEAELPDITKWSTLEEMELAKYDVAKSHGVDLLRALIKEILDEG